MTAVSPDLSVRFIKIFVFIVSLAVLGGVGLAYQYAMFSDVGGSGRPTAVKGVLDLRQWSFEDDGALPLQGEWRVVWNRLLEPADFESNILREESFAPMPSVWRNRVLLPPHSQGEGAATYRLRILLGDITSSRSLWLKPQHTDYRIWADTRLVAEGGRPALDSEGAGNKTSNVVVTIPRYTKTLDLTFQISNYLHADGGPVNPIIIGTSQDLAQQSNFDQAIFHFIMGALVVSGLSNLIIFLFRRRDEFAVHIGVFFLFGAARVYSQMIYARPGFDNWPLEWVWRLEYVSENLMLPFFMFYLARLFPRESNLPIRPGLWWLQPRWLSFWAGALMTTMVLISPPAVFTRMANLQMGVTLIGLMYVVALCVIAARRDRVRGLWVLASLVIAGAGAGLDILGFWDQSAGPQVFAYGLFVFLLFHLGLYAYAMAGNASAIVKLTRRLRLANQTLEAKVDRRTRDLEEESQNLQATFDSMADGILLVDANRQILSSNRRLMEILDCPAPILARGGDLYPLFLHLAMRGDFGSGNPDDIAQDITERFVSGTFRSFEMQLKTGKILEIRVNPMGENHHDSLESRLLNQGEEAVEAHKGGVVALFGDVTDSYRRQQELSEKSELLEATLKNMTDGLTVLDADGRLKVWNPRYFEFFKLPEHFAVQGTHYARIARYLAENGIYGVGRPDELVTERLKSINMPTSMTDERVTADNRVLDVRRTSLPGGGQINMYRDVSDLRQREAELNDAREMAEAASQAKSSFLATMSHEIRTPMNGVIGMLEMLRMTRLDDEQTDLLNVVHDSSQSLLAIINDILDFSKIEAGKLELESIEVDVLSLVEGVAELLASGAVQKGLALYTYIDPKVPQQVIADPTRIRQIMMNLAGNAIKFTDSGSVTLKVSLEDTTPTDVTLLFEVIDTGIGMNPDQQRNLFRAFTQADSSTTRKFGGTGLGLSISRHLTEMMRGEIGCESKEGLGTNFWFRLTLDTTKQTETDETDLAGLRLIMLEDSDVGRAIYEGYFEPKQTELTFVSSEHALRAALHDDTREFDVLIVDEGTLETDTFAFVEDLNQDKNAPRIPVILVSPLDSLRYRKHVRKTGYFAQLAKPIRKHILFQTLAAAARRAGGRLENQENELRQVFDPADIEGARATGRLILVAEDHPTNQKLIRMQLGRLGYACEMFENGALALEAWKQNSYGLVLTDFNMPEMDGIEMTRKIREIEEERDDGKHIPIVGLTAAAMVDEVQACLDAGMEEVLSKPINLKQLKVSLENHMSSITVVDSEDEPIIELATDIAWSGPSDDMDMERVEDEDDVERTKIGVDATSIVDMLRNDASTGTGQIPEDGVQDGADSALGGADIVIDLPEDEQPPEQPPEQLIDQGPGSEDNDFGPPVNLQTIEDFFGDDLEGALGMLESFYSTNLDISGQLTESLAARDQKKVKEHAHAIKGSSWSIGLQENGDIAGVMEKLAKDEDPDWARLDQLNLLLVGSFDRAAAEIDALKAKAG